MIKNSVIMFLLFWCFDAVAEDVNWYRVAANTAVAVDWLQTREIARSDEFYEKYNKFLGEQPTQNEVNRYFLTLAITYNILGELLPKPYSEFVYVYASLEHGRFALKNYNIGVRIKF